VGPILRNAVAQASGERRLDEAEAAEARRGDRTGQRSLAGLQPRTAPRLGESILECEAASGSEQGRHRLARDVACGEARYGRVEGGWRAAVVGWCHVVKAVLSE
jgi:hypothetical protein